MKLASIIFLLFILQVSLAFKDYKSESDWCIERNNLNPNEIYRIHKGGHLPDDNKDYSTFIECLWRKIRFLDAHGELNLQEIREMYYQVAREVYNQDESARRADAVIDKCRNIEGSTPALRAINMGNCLKHV